DGEAVFLRHVEVEDDEVRGGLLEQLAQRGAAVALAHLEAVRGEILPHHFARGRLVVDDDDVRDLGHAASRRAGSATVKVVPRPPPGLSAVTCPPCNSTIRLTMESPSPVELSPAVGFADRRWKRPNSRVMSSG